MENPAPATPDDKDWTWTTRGACAECGFDPDAITNDAIARAISARIDDAARTLGQPGAVRRPDATTWSPVEYGRHMADVCEVMTRRLDAILGSEFMADFESWDGEAAAVDGRYWQSTPDATVALLTTRGAEAAEAFARPQGRDWNKRGRRGDGVEFTARTLGLYLLHELTHHARDAAIGVRAQHT